jgi:uncharacterized protein (UPF0262 family)
MSSGDDTSAASPSRRIVKVDLDESSASGGTPESQQERAIAIFDLIEENTFAPAIEHDGPYHLKLAIEESRLVFFVCDTDDRELHRFILSLTSFRRIVKDYFDICDSYYKAIRSASPSQIEAIDMGRRGLHNEGSEILKERLKGKVEIDFNTARRLFTLICALFMRS